MAWRCRAVASPAGLGVARFPAGLLWAGLCLGGGRELYLALQRCGCVSAAFEQVVDLYHLCPPSRLLTYPHPPTHPPSLPEQLKLPALAEDDLSAASGGSAQDQYLSLASAFAMRLLGNPACRNTR